ncbi:MAG: exosortase A [Desulforhopalus sp.]|jgi:exosortase A
MNTQEKKNKTFIPLLLLLPASLLVAYSPVLEELFSAWSSSDEYSHGFFIAPISCYILWQKKDRLMTLPQEVSIIGCISLFCSLAVYLLAYYSEIKTVASLSLISTIASCVLFLYGPAVLKEISFPLLFLLFMIPIPAQIYSTVTIPLQLLVTKASVGLLAPAGIPILRDGNVIHIPQYTFEVVQACSGLRSLVSLWTLATIISYFTLQSGVLRGILMLCATPVAILVNICRVIIMITASYFWNYDLTEGTVHTILGLLIFLLAIVITLLIQGALKRWDISSQ